MFSKLWYLLLAVVVAVSLMAAYVANGVYNRSVSVRLNEQLVRDRTELEQAMQIEARARMDGILPIAAINDIRTALRDATGRRSGPIDPSAAARVRRKLAEVNHQLGEGSADILFAVDLWGEIVAHDGEAQPPRGAGLGAFPVVQRALSGYTTDDIWFFDNQLYRVAATPVIMGGQYVGAIVHTKVIDHGFAQRLAARVEGASVGFYIDDQLVAHRAGGDGAPGLAEMNGGIAAAREDAGYAEGGSSSILPLAEIGRAVYSPVTGTARHNGAGYVVARPVHLSASPYALFNDSTQEDRDQVPTAWIAILALLLGVLGIVFAILERDRPFKAFLAGVQALGRGEVQRLTSTDYRGGLRGAAEDVNGALDKVAGSAAPETPRVQANLDEILGSAPKERESVPFFGFASDDANANAEIPDVPPAPPAAAPTPAFEAPAAPAPAPAPPAPTPPPAAPAPPPAAPPAPAAPPPAPPAPAPPAPDLGGPEEDDDDAATMIAQIPQELLNASNSSNEQAEEERHFREVFDRFVAMKGECGESTAGLTFEKFKGTLRKNRDQILKQRGARRVRFTVYNKGGRAALKATPLKE